MVRRFEGLGKEDVALAGGKGANLGEMTRAGLPVPPGFVLLTPAYRAFVAANGLQGEIERLAGEVSAGEPASVDAASAAIRGLFDGGAIPEDIGRAVAAAYERMGGGLVAVRSSATAEDLPGASFAGQQETYLNLNGPEQVLAAVQRCWSSLWTARALSYRARQGIHPAEVALAVVVQRLVTAEAAGVLFTADPVSGRRDRMAIDGSWGLGESVVSGQVTPDHWVADARTGAILEAHIATKKVWTVRREGGTVTEPVPMEMRERPVLDEPQVAALVDLGRRVAAHYGSPQDIEWALAEGRLYLVQARPITSLFPLPAPEPPPEAGLRVYVCGNIMQGLVEPATPMGISAFKTVGRGVAKLWGYQLGPGEPPPVFKVAASRVFVDVTGLLKETKGHDILLRISSFVDRPTSEALKAVVAREPRLAPDGSVRIRPPWGFILRVVLRAIYTLLFPGSALRRALAAMDARVGEIERRAGELKGAAERRRFVKELMPSMLPYLFLNLGSIVAPGLGSRFIAEGRLQEWLGDASGLQPVLRALPNNPTTEMDLVLWRLSRTLKKEGAEPAAGHPGVRAFLAKYGHRGVREIDLGMPRWTDDPGHILNVLRTYLTHDEASDPEHHFRQGVEAAERTAKALVDRVRREKGIFKAALLHFLLSRTRALAGTREYPKFYAVRFIAVFRRVLAAVGEELVAAGRLDRADDIFFLDLRDLDSNADLRAIAAANRAEYQLELGRRSVPRLITSEGETVYAVPAAVEGALIGAAASAGVYEGRVRVIHDPRGAKLEPGEVLVAPGTDPAWTPLFLSAGALVMEIGGMMSHGSVVAREYGIPAVVGVAGATQRLKTGQRVRVDGEAGQVVPLDH